MNLLPLLLVSVNVFMIPDSFSDASMLITGILFDNSSKTEIQAPGDADSANASQVTTRVSSDLEEIDFLITFNPETASQDYVAEVASSIQLTDEYATERQVDRGLIFLEGTNQVESYSIPHESILAVIQVRYDMDVYDKTDVILTQENVVLVHTVASNAGLFVRSDVFLLPLPETGFEYIGLLEGGDGRIDETHLSQ